MQVKTIAAFCIVLGVLVGCHKPNTYDLPTPRMTAPAVTPSDAAGVLSAIKTFSDVNLTDSLAGDTATAVFGNVTTGYSIPGSVVCEGYLLTGTSLGNFAYPNPDSLNPTTRIPFVRLISWFITNNGNNIPDFYFYNTKPFPTVGAIMNGNSIIQTNAAYQLSMATAATNADSVIFRIAGKNGSAQYTLPANTTSFTFHDTIMKGLGTGLNAGFIQIASYNTDTLKVGLSKFYFVNEAVVSKVITLQ